MFPIRDATKRVVGFGGRTLGDARAKYLNTPQSELFDKGRLLYGLDVARPQIASTGQAIVVEGYTDCIACHQAGFGATVATLGTAMTEAHAGQLRRYGREIILVFDSDAAGDAAAERALEVALRFGLAVRLAFVPQGKDPCGFLAAHGHQAFESLLNSATDALRFSWDRTRSRFDSGEGDAGRRQAILEFVRLVSGLAQGGAVDAIQQGLIANQVAKLLNLRSEQVHRLFAQAARPRGRTRADSVEEPPVAPAARRTVSAQQSALAAILEVLLNEPGLYPQAQSVFVPQQFADPDLARLAGVVERMAAQFGEFTLVELLDRLPDPADAQRATELHLRGEARGKLQATLTGAVECLQRIAAARRLSGLTEAAGQRNDQGDTKEEQDPAARLAELQRVARGFRGFAPRSKLTAVREGEI
jgi:DNA primase